MKKNKIIILKNGTDVFGKKIEILINGEIIEKIYYDDESARSVAKKNNISHPALIKKRNKILEKLKRLLKDFR